MSLQILPGLQAFCIACAIAIASIFILQTSWFVAWMTIDEMRIEVRNVLVPANYFHEFSVHRQGLM